MTLHPLKATPWRAPKTVGVLAGGRSAEREISLESGATIASALKERGYKVTLLDVSDDLCESLRKTEIDVAVVALHGRWGEDGCVQGLLEVQGIPYTGSGVLASALAMDKIASKRLFDATNLPTPPWIFPATLNACLNLGFPLVLKPRAEGSSVGLAVVHDEASLRKHLLEARDPLLAESYIPGRELTVAVLGHGDDTQVLGTLEIRTAEGLYDYQAKYDRDDTEYLVPAPLSDAARDHLVKLARRAHALLACQGATRVDFRWPDPADAQTQPAILEINTSPGMTAHSLLPNIAKAAGWTYTDLVETLLADASLKA